MVGCHRMCHCDPWPIHGPPSSGKALQVALILVLPNGAYQHLAQRLPLRTGLGDSMGFQTNRIRRRHLLGTSFW